MIDQRLVLLGAAVNLGCSSAYVRETIAGRTRPNRATWALWTASPLVAFSAELTEGVGLQAIPTLMSGVLTLLVFLATFVNRRSTWRLGGFDYSCAAFSAASLILWWLTHRSDVAIVFAILGAASATLPTLLKLSRHPRSESPVAYVGGLVSAAIGLFTASTVSVATLAYPAYLVVTTTVLILAITLPRRSPRVRRDASVCPAAVRPSDRQSGAAPPARR